jgi:hypothetical protein
MLHPKNQRKKKPVTKTQVLIFSGVYCICYHLIMWMTNLYRQNTINWIPRIGSFQFPILILNEGTIKSFKVVTNYVIFLIILYDMIFC